jgi:O-antigen/teichoic acid export membrane protein
MISTIAINIFGRERVRQTALLYGSEIGIIALTFGTGILNSRFLGPEEYGIYTFVITVVQALMIFAGLGFPQAGARVVALARDRNEERVIGGSLVVIAALIGLAMAALLAIASPLIESVFRIQHKHSLLFASLISTSAPMVLVLTQACRGGNQIPTLAGLNILPKALYLVGAILVIWLTKLTALWALLLYFLGTAAACLFAAVALNVRFHGLRTRIREVFEEVKSYGFKSYLGGIADNSTFKLNNLLIAGYVDTTWLGFYAIASTVVSPMGSFSTSLSSSIYRSLATKDRIGGNIFLANTAFLLLSGLFIVLTARTLIRVVLTESFLPATGLVYVLVFTAFFQGMYQPITAFLASHGKGRELRAISLWVSLANICAAVLLIPRLGALGAAFGSAFAKLCELSGNLYYYRKIRHEIESCPAVVTS